MLTQLSIRNVVLIEKLELDFAMGLSVLTGETGAGKSILLDSLGLGLGARSEASVIRAGSDQASVSLTFQLPKNHPSKALLHEQGLRDEPSDEPLILRRVIGRDGRSKAFIDDQPVAVNLLKKIGEMLVEVHGQFETHGLLNRDTHIGFLDSFAGNQNELVSCKNLYQAWQVAVAAYAATKAQVDAAQKQAEDIAAALSELKQLNPQLGEADALAEKRTRLQNHEKIMEALQSAHRDISQEDKGAQRLAASARRVLTRAAEKAGDVLNPTLQQLDIAENALAEVSAHLENLLHSDAFDAAALEKSEERLFALRAAARKYRMQVDDLPKLYVDLTEQANLLEHSGKELGKLEKDMAQKRSAFEAQAKKLHEGRLQAALALQKVVHKELPPLKLENARFEVQVELLPLDNANANGMSRVTFAAATNPGMPSGALHKVASGGELARFMLALRLCLAEDASATTLVFDEVDTGIGGATASAVGERLAKLGKTIQTLVVTHSPQVAARGNHHWRIQKQTIKGFAQTAAITLEGIERREEIARMLAGSTVTEAARAAADSLLDCADEPPPTKSARRKAS